MCPVLGGMEAQVLRMLKDSLMLASLLVGLVVATVIAMLLVA